MEELLREFFAVERELENDEVLQEVCYPRKGHRFVWHRESAAP